MTDYEIFAQYMQNGTSYRGTKKVLNAPSASEAKKVFLIWLSDFTNNEAKNAIIKVKQLEL